jgi:hypothetical protein
MLNFASYFLKGVKNTLRFKDGVNFSHKGPWKIVYPDTIIDEWYVGDFMSAEYTISIDNGTRSKEIIKCLVVAGPDTASLVTYGRINLETKLVEVSATVISSRVSIVVNPAVVEGLTPGRGAKLIFNAVYFHTVNSLEP